MKIVGQWIKFGMVFLIVTEGLFPFCKASETKPEASSKSMTVSEKSTREVEPSTAATLKPIYEPLQKDEDGNVANLPGEELQLIDVVNRFIQRKDYLLVQSIIDRALLKDSLSEETRATLLFYSANLEMEKGDPTKAIVLLRSWLEMYPRRPEVPLVSFLLGQTYRQMGSFDDAQTNFYRAMTTAVARNTFRSEKEFESAREVTKSAAWELAETAYQMKDWEKALNFFIRFSNQNPEITELVATAKYRQADCFFNLSKVDDAMNTYKEAITLSPYHAFAPEAWLRLTRLFAAKKMDQEQEQAIETFIVLVQTKFPEQLDYWQERCASTLLDIHSNNPAMQKQILTRFKNVAGSESWNNLHNFYASLYSRSNDEAIPVDTDPQVDKDWTKWKKEFQEKLEKMHSEAADLPERKDPQTVSKNPTQDKLPEKK